MERLLRAAPVESPDDDRELVAGLRRHEPWAPAALVERHGVHLRKVLIRVLGGGDSELGDAFQEVILHAWKGIGRLNDPLALKAWLTRIAIFTARKAIRRRRRNRWLLFFEHLPEPPMAWADAGLREAAAGVYRIFERMPVDERIPFALRMLEGMDLEATAAACGMSVATVRRRLQRAEQRFFKMARRFEALEPWLGSR